VPGRPVRVQYRIARGRYRSAKADRAVSGAPDRGASRWPGDRPPALGLHVEELRIEVDGQDCGFLERGITPHRRDPRAALRRPMNRASLRQLKAPRRLFADEPAVQFDPPAKGPGGDCVGSFSWSTLTLFRSKGQPLRSAYPVCGRLAGEKSCRVRRDPDLKLSSACLLDVHDVIVRRRALRDAHIPLSPGGDDRRRVIGVFRPGEKVIGIVQ
jgi:hypothetical protein